MCFESCGWDMQHGARSASASWPLSMYFQLGACSVAGAQFLVT